MAVAEFNRRMNMRAEGFGRLSDVWKMNLVRIMDIWIVYIAYGISVFHGKVRVVGRASAAVHRSP